MMDMPEGFDLRDRRSTKTSSAADWQARDALYSASQSMPVDATCAFVCWKAADGKACWRAAGTAEQLDSLLLRALLDRRAT